MIIGDELVSPENGDKMWTVVIDEDRKTQLILAKGCKTVFLHFHNGPTVTRVALTVEAAESLGLAMMYLDAELHPENWEDFADPFKQGDKP